MYRRYFQWWSWGFAYILGSLDEKSMREIFNSFSSTTTPPPRKDSALAIMLANKSLLEFVSKEYRTPDGVQGEPPTFTRLCNALHEAENRSFDADTHFEFHQLLVATILGYGRTLQALANAMTKPDDGTRGSSAQQFLRFSRLLWRIAYSQSLTQHLEMLEAGHFLRLPSDHEEARYQSYAGFAETDESGIEGGEDEGSEMKDDLAQRLQVMRRTWLMYPNANYGMAKSFRKWMRIIVGHWGSHDAISSYCKSKGCDLRDFSISVVSVKSPPCRGSSLGDWKGAIRELASNTSGTSGTEPTEPNSFDADDVIQKLETEFTSGHPDFVDCSIIKSFRSAHIREQKELERLQKSKKPQKSKEPAAIETVKSNPTVHCEAALGFLKCKGHFPDDPVLSNLVQVYILICIDRHLIAVRTGNRSNIDRCIESQLSCLLVPVYAYKTSLQVAAQTSRTPSYPNASGIAAWSPSRDFGEHGDSLQTTST
jgi:hypothetical protein